MTIQLNQTTIAQVDGPKLQEVVDVWTKDSSTNKPLHYWRFTRLRHDDRMYIERVSNFASFGSVEAAPDINLADAAVSWLRNTLPDTE